MYYQWLRRLMFALNPEHAHSLGLTGLKLGYAGPWRRFWGQAKAWKKTQVMGLAFPNPLGLAAGLDKNGDYVGALCHLGFGFVEIGTVTPRAQLGNAQPRLFRLTKNQAIINRMGFNNKGVDYLAQKIQAMPRCCILGINIGKNKSTPLETAVNDYRYGLERAYPLADYITLNISSPNTPGLRALQQKNYLFTLLESLKQQQALLANAYQRYVPLVVKIDPDLSEAALVELADILISCQIDGVIATNTTVAREHLAVEAHSEQAGGLSGRPLFQRSTHVIAQLQQHLKGALPIIGVGGIDSGAAAIKKLAAGASLLQIYSSLIYQGPSVIQDIRRAIVAKH